MSSKTVTTIGWIASGLGAFAAILNILLIKECFILWTLGNIWWMYRGIVAKESRPQLLLFGVFTILNVWGFIQWSNQ